MSEAAWAAEIRGWLLARVSRRLADGSLEAPERFDISQTPLADWWVLEGQKHAVLEGPLLHNLDEVARRGRRLLSTYNRRRRVLDNPDGAVDWHRTAVANIGRPRSMWAWHCEVSAVGLTPPERSALTGWLGWLAGVVERYTHHWRDGRPDVSALRALCRSHRVADRHERRRWAHVARRSRWPLLRHVVADSLRFELDQVTLETLPLPEKKWRLFELLCVVRLVRALNDAPAQIRWLSPSDRNTLRFDDLWVRYQRNFHRDLVLGTPFYGGGLGEAVRNFSLRIHNDTDICVEFPRPRNGYRGVLLEAKSGDQNFEAAMLQFAAYRGALQRLRPGRYLVWGVAEKPNRALTPDRLAQAQAFEGDTWVFSSPEEIPRVVAALGL